MTRNHSPCRWPSWLLGVLALALLLGIAPRSFAAEPVELLFVYGSEKKEWINDVTAAFHATNPMTRDGRPIKVTAEALGSGETVRDVLERNKKAHLISPASGAYIQLGNAEAKDLKQEPLVKGTRNLVRSPVVIAMWKPMAVALGWPDKPIGWDDLRKLAVAPDGWGSVGHKEWGSFKFGHTHPDYSNSGLIAVFAQVFAATGKEEITVLDVEAKKTERFVNELQKSLVHYGESTGFFGDKMFENGDDYLSAAVLYENMVVESYGPKWKGKLKHDVVAIYPKEGTFWSDHPVGIVERDWVEASHREAAEQYINYLLQEPQQLKALKYGFRPGLERVKVGAPIDKQHGVDPDEPKKILARPSVEVMRAALRSWRQNKKNVRLILVLDRSGSMNDDDKLIHARKACINIIESLGTGDTMGILTFSDGVEWVSKGQKLNGPDDRKLLIDELKKVKADGETALYDAIAEAHRHLQTTRQPGEITAIIVLTDGDDNKSKPDSKTAYSKLIRQVQYDPKNGVETRIYTIAYGSSGADAKVLKSIADATKATASEGQPETIKKVITKIITFF
jgi:Ca-activated chloride channel family protein